MFQIVHCGVLKTLRLVVEFSMLCGKKHTWQYAVHLFKGDQCFGTYTTHIVVGFEFCYGIVTISHEFLISVLISDLIYQCLMPDQCLS